MPLCDEKGGKVTKILLAMPAKVGSTAHLCADPRVYVAFILPIVGFEKFVYIYAR